jgi:acetolactate synthase small subunit
MERDAERGVVKKEPRTVSILVETADNPGVLAEVADAIAACQVNISECFIKTTGDERAHMNFTIVVTEFNQLDQVMSEVGALESVILARQIVSGQRKVAIVGKSGIDGDGQRWAELRSGEIVYSDSTSYRNLTIEAEEMVIKD